jgi:hypothetical protein
MSYTATYTISGAATASITLTISTTANGNGDYPVTGISGTWDGQAITGLISFEGSDNLAVPPGSGGFDDLDEAGVSFSVAGGVTVNIFGDGGVVKFDDNGGNLQVPLTTTFSTDVPCFLRGTRILTEHGDVAVEDLAIGDRVMTITGHALPIRWIGQRRFLPDPLARRLWGSVAPVRVRKDAITEGVPSRDLLLSPDHSLYLGGHLINAKHLLNGVSVVQDTGIADIAYFHVELERHEVILAEGVPVETYLENGNRTQFHNADAAGATAAAPRSAWYAPHAYGHNPVLAQVRTALEQGHAEVRAA